DAEGSAGRLYRVQIWCSERRRLRVINCDNPKNSWLNLFKELQHFAADGGLKIGKAGNVAARTCQALNEALLNGLGDIHKDYRNCAAFSLEGCRYRRRSGKQHVGLYRNQFLCRRFNKFDVAAGPADGDIEHPSFDPTTLRKPSAKRRH